MGQNYIFFKLIYFCTVSPPLIRPPLLQRKSGLIRVVTSLEGNNLAVIYYLSKYEIRPDKRGGLWLEGPY